MSPLACSAGRAPCVHPASGSLHEGSARRGLLTRIARPRETRPRTDAYGVLRRGPNGNTCRAQSRTSIPGNVSISRKTPTVLPRNTQKAIGTNRFTHCHPSMQRRGPPDPSAPHPSTPLAWRARSWTLAPFVRLRLAHVAPDAVRVGDGDSSVAPSGGAPPARERFRDRRCRRIADRGARPGLESREPRGETTASDDQE